MRINKYVALATGMSRRAADSAIANGEVSVNGQPPEQGQDISPTDVVALQGRSLAIPVSATTLMFNKPAGLVVSRQGQGNMTIYDILPAEYHDLKPVGRLDKDSSGLLLLTNDGQLAHDLTHPSHQKTKIYEVTLDKPLAPLHQQIISDHGVTLEDGPSQFLITRIDPAPSAGGERSEPREDKADSSEATSHLGRGEPLLDQREKPAQSEPGEKQAAASAPVPSAGGERSEPREERADSERSDTATRGGASPSLKDETAAPVHTSNTNLYQITMHEGRNRQIRRTFAALGYQVATLHRTQFGPYQLNNLGSGALKIMQRVDTPTSRR